MKPLTAQEALEQEGYIVARSRTPLKLGIVECAEATFTGVPIGATAIIVGEISKEESDAYGERVGWPAEESPSGHFYKMIAE